MTNEEIDKLEEFTQSLRSRYNETRKLLEGLEGESLFENNNYKNCIKIALMIFTMRSSPEGLLAYYGSCKNSNFDIDKLLSMFDIQFKTNEQGKLEPVIISKNEDA